MWAVMDCYEWRWGAVLSVNDVDGDLRRRYANTFYCIFTLYFIVTKR